MDPLIIEELKSLINKAETQTATTEETKLLTQTYYKLRLLQASKPLKNDIIDYLSLAYILLETKKD